MSEPVSLTDQIACVSRELAMRKAVYSRKVHKAEADKTPPERVDKIKADCRREYDAMSAVLATLNSVERFLAEPITTDEVEAILAPLRSSNADG